MPGTGFTDLSHGRAQMRAMERPLSQLIAEARQNALQARKNALQLSDDNLKREWRTVAVMWDCVAEGYQHLFRDMLRANRDTEMGRSPGAPSLARGESFKR